MSNNLSLCYLDGRSNDRYSVDLHRWAEKLVIRDMGVNVSADGVNSVNVKMNGQNQLYAYWIRATPDKKVPCKNGYTEKCQMMAAMSIPTKKLHAAPAAGGADGRPALCGAEAAGHQRQRQS